MMYSLTTELKDYLQSNYPDAHIEIMDFEDFIPENYLAMCISPKNSRLFPGSTLSMEYDESDGVLVTLVEQAPQDRDKTSHIQNVEELINYILENPMLNENFNQGLEIGVNYKRRAGTDNIEFVTELEIEGRNI